MNIVNNYLKVIAAEFNVDWEPSIAVDQERFDVAMSAPQGGDVLAGQGSGITAPYSVTDGRLGTAPVPGSVAVDFDALDDDQKLKMALAKLEKVEDMSKVEDNDLPTGNMQTDKMRRHLKTHKVDIFAPKGSSRTPVSKPPPTGGDKPGPPPIGGDEPGPPSMPPPRGADEPGPPPLPPSVGEPAPPPPPSGGDIPDFDELSRRFDALKS